MHTLDKWDVKSILQQLSLLEGNQDFMAQMYPTLGGIAGNNKGMIENIRDMLLGVAITDVSVEQLAEAAD